MEANGICITDDDYPTIQCFVPGGNFKEVPFIIMETDRHPDVETSYTLLFDWIEKRVAERSADKKHHFSFFPMESVQKIFQVRGFQTYTVDDILTLPIQSGTLLFPDGFQLVYALIDEVTTKFWFDLPGKALAVAEVEGGVWHDIEIARLDGNIYVTSYMHATPRPTTGDLLKQAIPFLLYLNQNPSSRILGTEMNSTSATIYEII